MYMLWLFDWHKLCRYLVVYLVIRLYLVVSLLLYEHQLGILLTFKKLIVYLQGLENCLLVIRMECTMLRIHSNSRLIKQLWSSTVTNFKKIKLVFEALVYYLLLYLCMTSIRPQAKYNLRTKCPCFSSYGQGEIFGKSLCYQCQLVWSFFLGF